MNAIENHQLVAPHNPVLLPEVLGALCPDGGGVFVDGTFGAGGYSRGLLEQADCQVFGIDRDPNTYGAGAVLAKEFDGRFQLLEGCFADMQKLLEEVGVSSVDGVTLDIGVSSMQLDQAERGFSFMADGPLDMRMSQRGVSAADVVNEFALNDLKRIFKVYGEEKRAHSIAAAIGRARTEQAFSRTGELARLIEKVIGVRPGPRKSIHPATRIFQALRIFVNGELDELVRGLAAAERVLKPGGRLAVVSFHSLEDRIVKRFLKKRTGSLPNPSRHAPEVQNRAAASFVEIARGGITASAEEIDQNPRARSARLRVAERTTAQAIALDDKELAQGRLEGLSC
jgi:16S rRNA (cytosine1402-N4)-methyltransferase